MKKFLIVFWSIFQLAVADVKSPDGIIHFDSNSDATPEASLNATGLGIGKIPSANLDVSGNVIISGQLMVGGVSATSNLHIHGTLGFNTLLISDNTVLGDTVSASMILVDTRAGNIMLTLPYAANVLGKVLQIKKTDLSNDVIITPYIDRQAQVLLPSSTSQRPNLEVISDGEAWWILSVTSANTSQSFDSQSNLVLWLDAADTSSMTLDAAGNIIQWNDRSGNDHHAVQNTDNNRPEYVANGLNGLNTISLETDGGYDWMSVSGNFAIGTFFAVFNADSTDGTFVTSGTGDFQSFFVSRTDPTNYSMINVSQASAWPYRLSATHGTANIKLNGVVNREFNPLSEFKVFSNVGASVSIPKDSWEISNFWGNNWEGDIAEIICFDSLLSSEEIIKIETYLSKKWGISF